MHRTDPVSPVAAFDEECCSKTVEGIGKSVAGAAGCDGKCLDILIWCVCKEVVDPPVQILFFHLYTFRGSMIIGFRSARESGYYIQENSDTIDTLNDTTSVSFSELACIADQILEKAEDDPEILAQELDGLAPGIRNELLTSDLLNAYQVFFYFFREDPGDLEQDRLTLQPASALMTGVMMSETELSELFFSIEAGEPVFSVSDGDRVVARFRGADAYQKALQFLDESF